MTPTVEYDGRSVYKTCFYRDGSLVLDLRSVGRLSDVVMDIQYDKITRSGMGWDLAVVFKVVSSDNHDDPLVSIASDNAGEFTIRWFIDFMDKTDDERFAE